MTIIKGCYESSWINHYQGLGFTRFAWRLIQLPNMTMSTKKYIVINAVFIITVTMFDPKFTRIHQYEPLAITTIDYWQLLTTINHHHWPPQCSSPPHVTAWTEAHASCWATSLPHSTCRAQHNGGARADQGLRSHMDPAGWPGPGWSMTPTPRNLCH